MERLSFKIKLKSTLWDKVPEYRILLDDALIETGTCESESLVEFDHDVSEGDHIIGIELTNKDNTDCVTDDQGNILKDMLLHIDNISIDNVELQHILHTSSEFVPKDKDRPTLPQCVDLGWNGTYRLKFTSPFYIWLLENM